MVSMTTSILLLLTIIFLAASFITLDWLDSYITIWSRKHRVTVMHTAIGNEAYRTGFDGICWSSSIIELFSLSDSLNVLKSPARERERESQAKSLSVGSIILEKT